MNSRENRDVNNGCVSMWGKMRCLFGLLLLSCMIFASEPTIGSIILRVNGGVGDHSSDFSKKEQIIADSYGMYSMLYNSDTEMEEMIDIEYSYHKMVFGADFFYHPWYNIGLGLQYQHSIINQKYDFPTRFDSYEDHQRFITTNQIGPAVNVWIYSNDNIGLSACLGAHYSFGTINRIPTFIKDYSEEDEFSNLLSTFNKDLKINGIGGTLHGQFMIFMTDISYITFQGHYNYTSFDITDDPIGGYIKNSKTKESGIIVGLGILVDY